MHFYYANLTYLELKKYKMCTRTHRRMKAKKNSAIKKHKNMHLMVCLKKKQQRKIKMRQTEAKDVWRKISKWNKKVEKLKPRKERSQETHCVIMFYIFNIKVFNIKKNVNPWIWETFVHLWYSRSYSTSSHFHKSSFYLIYPE